MSLSVKNGGIGKSPAISRISRLAPEKESKAIAHSMRQVVQPVETRPLSIGGGARLEMEQIWNSLAPVALNPHYPTEKLNVHSLTEHILTLTSDNA
ncbi:MAG: hypothetical protein LBH09_08040 [Peptococcaceae bacterium]|jgi:hypothetical protein|nr:hypothetical protein [Peptococcaceae bacterium]